LAGLACSALALGCFFGVSAASASAAVTLNASGSTLVAPILAEWGTAWGNATGNKVNYQALGSGTGYKQVASGQTDFGASDAPLSVYSSPACAPNLGGCLEIPWGLTATGVSFNIPGVNRLHLDGSTLAGIYLGSITNWNDARIRRLNKGVHLPNLPIQVFYRSDGSGDTYAFTRYLSDVNRSFASTVGSSTAVHFPTGRGAQGNTGMVAAVQGTPGGIAYIAVSYLINARMPAVGIKNAAGRFAVPNLLAIEAAARAFSPRRGPNGSEITIQNPPRRAKSAYPISTYTYVFVPRNAPQGGWIRSFIDYALGQGQSFGPRLDFAPIPNYIKGQGLATASQIQ
jgi:phosphate transport system substrate-binding protein